MELQHTRQHRISQVSADTAAAKKALQKLQAAAAMASKWHVQVETPPTAPSAISPDSFGPRPCPYYSPSPIQEGALS